MISEHAAEIFLEARTLDSETRADFVSRACEGNEQLLGEVNSLLDASNESDAYFEQLVGKVGLSSLADDDPPLPANKRIGAWRLLKRIGRGGMGAVYLAERADGQFEHRAALKILPTGLDSGEARARFLIERQILARLVHDNIARLLDGGVTEEGVPYFVMDYVEGWPIDEYCDRNELGVTHRLRLVLDIARAVQFAHRNLIIHRDLKPSNVLVDGDGRVRLLDFGIAKILRTNPADAQLTQFSRRPATPAFASPEMLRGEPVDVTTDVYSIGALMYELLTGRQPFSYEGLSLSEMFEHAAHTVPEPVSRFNPDLKGDIDAIVAKTLAKLPEERYASVESLANDLLNYLEGMPVAAKTPSAAYRARKFLGRHRLGAAFAAFVVIALASITGLALRSALVSDRQAKQVALERDRAEQTRDFLISIFDAADPNVVPGNQTAREVLEAGRERIGRELADHPAVRADLLKAMGSVYRSWRLAPEGRDVLEQELTLRAVVNGKDSAEYRAVLIELSVIADIAGDYEASLGYATEALQISERSGDRLGMAAGHERVGRMLHLQGDYEGAGAHFRDALAILVGELGAEAIEVAYVREHLANLLDHQQRDEEALAEFQRSLEIRKRHVDGDSSDISSLYLGMGSPLIDLGRLDEAQAAYLTGYEMNDRLYGPGNSYNSYFANGLGKVAEALGDLEAAASRYTEAVNLVLKHTPESPNLAFVNANLGKVYRLQGRCDLAISSYRAADEMFTMRLPAHWARGDVKTGLGACLAESGDFAEAESLMLSGIEIVEKQWGREHEITAKARSAAALLYDAWEKPDKAALFR